MGLIDDLMADSMSVLFTTDGFGETVTVEEGGQPDRTITAIVTRAAPELNSDYGHRPVITVEVRNHATEGISSTTFAEGIYRLRFPRQHGQPPVSFGIKLQEHDAVALTFRCS